ncbi:MAG: hypothetical protein MJ016_01230 [Victivallaceae bacterium]|nr:hypothetical protein [Victivallaceae bacterium]
MPGYQECLDRAVHAADFSLLLESLFDAQPQDDALAVQLPSRLCRQRSSEQRAWCRLIAQWLFFLHLLEMDLPRGAEDYFSVPPFGDDTPDLQTLLQYRGGIAVFPLADMSGGKPQKCRLFLVDAVFANDHRAKLKGTGKVIPEQCSVFLSSAMEFDGNSWQLAASLAGRALEADTGIRRGLAWHWIATGAVYDGEVRKVEIGNKTQLDTKRHWLLPESERTALSGEQYVFVDSVEQAWNWVLGKKIVSSAVSLMEPVEELHILVGESQAPVIACALMIWPQKIILYRTEKTKEHSAVCRRVLETCKLSVEEKSVPSDDMCALNGLFEAAFSDSSRKNIVVNPTGGNRLMGYAALLAAAKNTQVQAVYRDTDGKDFELQILSFKGGKVLNGIQEVCRFPQKWSKKICWDKLFHYRGKFSNEEFLALFPFVSW